MASVYTATRGWWGETRGEKLTAGAKVKLRRLQNQNWTNSYPTFFHPHAPSSGRHAPSAKLRCLLPFSMAALRRSFLGSSKTLSAVHLARYLSLITIITVSTANNSQRVQNADKTKNTYTRLLNLGGNPTYLSKRPYQNTIWTRNKGDESSQCNPWNLHPPRPHTQISEPNWICLCSTQNMVQFSFSLIVKYNLKKKNVLL